MGWTFGWNSRKDLISHLISNMNWERTIEDASCSCKLLAHCCVGNNLWAVCESRKSDRAPYRFIVLFLMKKCKDSYSGESDWGYKDMDESMGPFYYSCPLKYLDLAPYSDTLGESSKKWREAVREYWADLHNSSTFAKSLKPGDQFLWGGKPVTFIRFQGKTKLVGSSLAGIFLYRRKHIRPLPAQATA